MSTKPKLKTDKLMQHDPVDIQVFPRADQYGNGNEDEAVWVRGEVSYVMRLADPFNGSILQTSQCRVIYTDPFRGEDKEEHFDLSKK
jgi:hypothetical protein